MWRWLLILLFLAGCRTASDRPATTTTSVLPPETTATTMASTTSTVSAAFAVPAVIDLPYVQRVLEAIYHLDGEATRHVYATKVPDAELEDRLEAIFGGQTLSESKRILRDNADEGFTVYANPPGDAQVRAVEIIQATPKCMVIRADLDYGPQFKEYRPPQPKPSSRLQEPTSSPSTQPDGESSLPARLTLARISRFAREANNCDVSSHRGSPPL